MFQENFSFFQTPLMCLRDTISARTFHEVTTTCGRLQGVFRIKFHQQQIRSTSNISAQFKPISELCLCSAIRQSG